MAYPVVLVKRAQKDFNRVNLNYRIKMFSALFVLAEEPFIGKAMRGKYKDHRSYTVWPFKIIYQIVNTKLVVLLIYAQIS